MALKNGLFSWLPGFRILMVRLYDRSGNLLAPMMMHAGLVATQLFVAARALSGKDTLLYACIAATTIWILVGVSGFANRPTAGRIKADSAVPSPRMT